MLDEPPRLLTTRDARKLAPLLAGDVRFHSPVADYRGAADVAHLLTTIASVLDDVSGERTFAEGGETVTFVRGTVAGEPIEGVLDAHVGADGRVTDATLLLRPLATLRVAIARMGAALATAPLPSAR